MNQDTKKSGNIRNNRGVNIALIILSTSFSSVGFSGLSLFLPLIRSALGLTFTQGGALAAVPIFVYALMQIPAGLMADHYGLKKIFFIGVLGTSMLSFTFGLVAEYWQAFLAQLVSGIFRALIFASVMALLASWFGPERRATAMSLYLIGMFSGQLIVSALGPSLVRLYNWRFPFISFSSLGILAALVFLRLGKDSPQTESWQKTGITEAVKLFNHPFMWTCAILQYVRLAVMLGIMSWLPSLLIDEKGLSLQMTGLIIAIRSVLTAPSNLIGGYASDRLKNPSLIIGISLIVLAVTTMLLVMVDNMALLISLIFINAIFIQLYFGPLFAMPVERFGIKMAGTLSGFGNFFANLGGFTFTYLLGVIKDQTGYFESGFYAIAAVCVVGLVFTIMLEKMRRNAEQGIIIARS